MKIAMAINQKGDLENYIAEHFGQAKNFLIYDTESNKFIVEPNPEFLGKPELPPDFLHRLKVDTVITFGLGPRAHEKFKGYKIKMYKAIKNTVLKNIKALKRGELHELTEEDIF